MNYIMFPNKKDVLDVFAELEKTAPEGWIISVEYPAYIGITHKSFYDSDFIALGDINGYFSFNDERDAINGSMENLTDPQEIAASFWEQIAVFYPEQMKGE